MYSFKDGTLFHQLAQKGALNRFIVEDLADTIANCHNMATVNKKKDFGGSRGIALIIKNNAKLLKQSFSDVIELEKIDALFSLLSHYLSCVSDLLDNRRNSGQVRLCNGDLLLSSISVTDGRPSLFNPNNTSSIIDVLYDMSYLLMDFKQRDYSRFASLCFNRYFDITGEGERGLSGLRVLNLFISIRAASWALEHLIQSENLNNKQQIEQCIEEAKKSIELALKILQPQKQILIAIGGLSGSGKSKLAREMAPHLGNARVVRSDSTRKRLAGVSLNQRLNFDGYSAEMTERTFKVLFDEVAFGLQCGYPVIADAVFSNPGYRSEIAEIARNQGAPFIGIWLEATSKNKFERIKSRKRDVSDADAWVLGLQMKYKLGRIDWVKVDSNVSSDEILTTALKLIDNWETF